MDFQTITGIALLITCGSAFLSLVFGSTDVGGKPFNAGGSIGNWVGGWFAEYLNRTGSIIVLLTLMILSVILSTQFSFGRMFESASQSSRDASARGLGRLRVWLDARRKARERQEVMAKHAIFDPKPGKGASLPRWR